MWCGCVCVFFFSDARDVRVVVKGASVKIEDVRKQQRTCCVTVVPYVGGVRNDGDECVGKDDCECVMPITVNY